MPWHFFCYIVERMMPGVIVTEAWNDAWQDQLGIAVTNLNVPSYESFSLLIPSGDEPMASVGLVRNLRQRGVRAGILVVQGSSSSEQTVLALEAGADDVLTTTCNEHELRARLGAVLRRIAPIETAERPSPPRNDSFMRAHRLSPREIEILLLLVDGVQAKDVAWRLGCTHATVRTHVRRAMKKLRCNSVRELVILYYKGIRPAA